MTFRSRHRRPGPPPGTELARFLTGVASGLLLAVIWTLWEPFGPDPGLAAIGEVRDFVERSFVESVERESLEDDAIRGLVTRLDDYSRFYSREEIRSVERETQGRYEGIGVVFLEPLDAGRVRFAVPESPAARAGLDVGDRLVAIDGELVAEMPAGRLQRVIGDPARKRLEIDVEDLDGHRRELVVERRELLDPSVRHARFVDSEAGIGYVAVRGFSEETPTEFDRAVDGLLRDGLRGLIVDVRGNFGGLLHAAVLLANRFVAEGVLVSTRGRGEPVVYEAEPGEVRYPDLPLVVLVDGDSASASEVFAAALQDHRAAVLIGSPTYGKGTVQRVKALHDGRGVVKLTTSYYYTPSGRNLERTVEKAWEFGIVPDVWVPVDPQATAAIHAALNRYEVPEEALPKLMAWQARDGIRVVHEPPPDDALEAARQLLRGERPTLAGIGSAW